jgi:carboxylesterase type B
MTRIQDGSYGNACPQAVPIMFLVARPQLHGIEQSEDCLFLDVTIPGHVVRSKEPKKKKLAIVHWLIGGGFGISLTTAS